MKTAPETEFIGDVPQSMVQQFQEAFPCHPDLCKNVEEGCCDHVSHALETYGGTLDERQTTAVDAWWDLYHAVFQSE